MGEHEALVQGRAAYERRAWVDARDSLCRAGEQGDLAAADLERLAIASYLTSQDHLAVEAGVREMVRVTRPGGTVLVAAFGPLPRAEFVAFFLAAVRAVLPEAGPPPDGPLPPFRLSEQGAMQRTLEQAGLHDVRVDSEVWEMPFASADEFLATALSSNPIARQLTAGLPDEAFGQLRQVLDGMLRERSGGGPGAVLHTEMRIGRGIS